MTIRDEGAVIGTHVFTALERNDGGEGLRWVALTMPPEKPEPARKARAQKNPEPLVYRLDRRGRPIPVVAPKPAEPPAIPAPAAASVLDRIELSPETVARLSSYITAGASLIVSDHGLGYETGLYTDFIVVTR